MWIWTQPKRELSRLCQQDEDIKSEVDELEVFCVPAETGHNHKNRRMCSSASSDCICSSGVGRRCMIDL